MHGRWVDGIGETCFTVQDREITSWKHSRYETKLKKGLSYLHLYTVIQVLKDPHLFQKEKNMNRNSDRQLGHKTCHVGYG